MRLFFSVILSLFTYCTFAQSKGDVILRGGTFSYSHKNGVKPFLDISPGFRDKNGVGAGLGIGFTTIPQIDATTIPLFARVSYLPLDAPVGPAFQFHVGYAPISKALDGVAYSGGLYLNVSGGLAFNIKKNRGLLLQAGYGSIKVHKETTFAVPLDAVHFDGWMALLGFKF